MDNVIACEKITCERCRKGKPVGQFSVQTINGKEYRRSMCNRCRYKKNKQSFFEKSLKRRDLLEISKHKDTVRQINFKYNKESLNKIISLIKAEIKYSADGYTKRELSKAGIIINNLLLR